MSYVNIQFGAAQATVSPSAIGIACIIGTTAADVGLIKEVTSSTLVDTLNLPSGTGGGVLAVTDALYKAAMDYFLCNPSGTLVLVGIMLAADHSSAILNTAMTKIDIENWISQFSPISTWSDLSDNVGIQFKVKLTSVGATEAYDNQVVPTTNDYDTDTWYYVATAEAFDEDQTLGNFVDSAGNSIQLDCENGVYTGGITLMEDLDGGTNYDDKIRLGADGDESDTYVSFASIQSIIAHPTPPNIGFYMSDMIDSSVDFDAIAIGYDAEKAVGDATGERYAIADCPSGIGWYADFTYMCAMITQLFGSGQRAVYFGEVPVGASFGESLDDYDAANNGRTSDEIHSIVGTNDLVSTFYSIQDADGATNQISSGIAGMADFVKGNYREIMTFRTSAIPASSYPISPVASLWQDIRVNPYIQIRATGTSCWGSNWTHGSGNGKFLNFVMCRNILANKLEEALYNILFTRTLHIDLSSMERIKSTIRNVLEGYTGTYCDGFSSVAIPLETYLINGNTVEIAAAKDARTVGNVKVGFKWNGDVEYLNITGLYGE